MKKLLSVLTIAGIAGSASSTVVSCHEGTGVIVNSELKQLNGLNTWVPNLNTYDTFGDQIEKDLMKYFDNNVNSMEVTDKYLKDVTVSIVKSSDKSTVSLEASPERNTPYDIDIKSKNELYFKGSTTFKNIEAKETSVKLSAVFFDKWMTELNSYETIQAQLERNLLRFYQKHVGIDRTSPEYYNDLSIQVKSGSKSGSSFDPATKPGIGESYFISIVEDGDKYFSGRCEGLVSTSTKKLQLEDLRPWMVTLDQHQTFQKQIQSSLTNCFEDCKSNRSFEDLLNDVTINITETNTQRTVKKLVDHPSQGRKYAITITANNRLYFLGDITLTLTTV